MCYLWILGFIHLDNNPWPPKDNWSLKELCGAYFPQPPVYIHSCIFIHLCYLTLPLLLGIYALDQKYISKNHFYSVRCEFKEKLPSQMDFLPSITYVTMGSLSLQYTTSYVIHILCNNIYTYYIFLS